MPSILPTDIPTSFIAVKPDGVQRGLVGDIMSRFEKRGYKLVAAKLVSPDKKHLETHYEDLKDKPFFTGLVSCMLLPCLGQNNVKHSQSQH